MWANEEVMVDVVVNNGVFLCMQPGFYHFAAALSSDGEKNVGVSIVHNTRERVYARLLQKREEK